MEYVCKQFKYDMNDCSGLVCIVDIFDNVILQSIPLTDTWWIKPAVFFPYVAPLLVTDDCTRQALLHPIPININTYVLYIYLLSIFRRFFFIADCKPARPPRKPLDNPNETLIQCESLSVLSKQPRFFFLFCGVFFSLDAGWVRLHWLACLWLPGQSRRGYCCSVGGSAVRYSFQLRAVQFRTQCFSWRPERRKKSIRSKVMEPALRSDSILWRGAIL